MKPEVTLKYLSYLRNKKANNEGFTLIELLVVVIIIGVLAAVALPNLLGQVGKARETEIKNAVGTVNRSQQAYHFERQNFSPNVANLGIKIPSQYITNVTAAAFVALTNTSQGANVLPVNTNSAKDGTRAYSGRIVHFNGQYAQAMCQSNLIANSMAAPGGIDATSAGVIAAPTCTSGVVIK